MLKLLSPTNVKQNLNLNMNILQDMVKIHIHEIWHSFMLIVDGLTQHSNLFFIRLETNIDGVMVIKGVEMINIDGLRS